MREQLEHLAAKYRLLRSLVPRCHALIGFLSRDFNVRRRDSCGDLAQKNPAFSIVSSLVFNKETTQRSTKACVNSASVKPSGS